MAFVSAGSERRGPVAFARGPPSSKPVDPKVKLVAGMAGGVCEALALNSFDVTKTRLQLDKSGRYRGMVHALTTIAKEEGFFALYKGVTPFVTHLTIKYALRFGSFAWFRQLLGVSKDGKGDSVKNFSAGLLAGLTEAVLIVTPFEVVKTRLQQQEGLDKSKLRYRGPIHAATTIIQQEGPTALWKGVVPTMVRQGSNQAFLFMSFSLLQQHVFGRVEGDGQKQPLWKPFLCGLFASMVGPMFNCPMDVIKTRMMAHDGTGPRYNGVMDAVVRISKEEGVGALWKGLVPRLSRLAPGQAITWTVVSSVQSYFERRAIASAQDR